MKQYPEKGSANDEKVKERDNINHISMIADSVFVCGPPGMPEAITQTLLEEKLVQTTDDVHYEKWW